jgi:hypothetical protein
MEWTHLPKCERHSGFGTKLNICVGCEGYITPGDNSHFCLLRDIEYELDGTSFSPCGDQYNPEFIKVGKPFKTRLVRDTLGLQYPIAMTRFPFVFEACTVRAILEREFTWTSGDMQLLISNGSASSIWHKPGLRRHCREQQGNAVRPEILGRNTASNFSQRPQ